MPQDILRKYWGYDSFRPLQLDIILSVLDGHDTLGLLPTGGGKSITFQVPAMMLDGLTIVVTPLISLMKDQVDNLHDHGIRAYALYSGLSRAESRLAMDRCRLGKAKILYISPERMQNQNFLAEARDWNVSLIVVDEAHCISQWGYDFRPSYLGIKKLRQIYMTAPVLALTASATRDVARDIMTQLEFRPGFKTFSKSFLRDNLSYVVRHDEYKERTLLRVLTATQGCSIVYVRSRRRCHELTEMLRNEGISADYYHAGLESHDKAERQNAWKEDRVRVMVATNAFGMGIDKPDVRVVVHYDLPSSLEEYYQEAGRAGRDGLPSYAVVILSRTDKATLSRRVNDSFPPRDYIMRVYELLGNFLGVAVGSGYNEVYEFNYNRFCQTFRLQPTLVYSALQILTRAGYIDFADEVQTRTRVMITVQKRELYSLNLDNITDRVFTALQREYTGLFADFVYINEVYLARVAEVSEQQVYESLLKLSRLHVIQFVPHKSVPYVAYTTSREETRYLRLPVDVYENRRQRMQQRIRAVTEFAYGDNKCRSVTLLNYFGEDGAQPCGMCDICRSRRSVSQPVTSVDVSTVRPLMHLTPQQILSRFPESQRQQVIELIRQINDEN